MKIYHIAITITLGNLIFLIIYLIQEKWYSSILMTFLVLLSFKLAQLTKKEDLSLNPDKEQEVKK